MPVATTTRERLLDGVSPVFGREEQLQALETTLEDASDPTKPKQVVFLYGQSGLAKTQLVELALGVYNERAVHSDSDNRTSTCTTNGSVVTYSQRFYPPRKHPPKPCWYCYGKYTQRQEDKPFAEISQSIAELILRQLVPKLQRLPTRGSASQSNRSTTSRSTDSVSSISDVLTLLRKHLTGHDVEVLIKFCPEFEQLHLYTARERAVDQTKRAARAATETAQAVTNFVGKGVAMMTPVFPKSFRYSNADNGIQELSSSGIDNRTKPTTSRYDPMERLKDAVKTFFRALSEIRPVVLVFGDLQYSTKDGQSSILFIESILEDPELKQLLFCGIVRVGDKSRNERKRLAMWTQSILLPVTELKISRMTEKNVRSMLTNLLQLGEEDLGPLAALIYQRTGGVDYSVFEMINYLQETGILYFSTRNFRWSFDVDEAKRKTMVTEDVLSFVGRRLSRLPLTLQWILKLAACLGYRFDEDLLVKVIKSDFVQEQQEMKNVEDINVVVSDLLQTAVDEEFIERLLHPNQVKRYKFVHVEIQTACEHLFDTKEKMKVGQLHWNIGAALWRGWRNLEDYENVENRILFPCVKELNTGRSCFKLRKETVVQLVRLDYETARRSCNMHAFFPAAAYLESAVDLAGRNAWVDHYAITLMLYTFLAQMYLASGQLRKIPRIVRIVGEHAKSFQDRLPVDLVELHRCRMVGNIQEHIRKSISLLNCLGVSLSGSYFWFQTERKKRRVKASLETMTDDEFRQKTSAVVSFNEAIESIESGLVHSLIISFEDHDRLENEYPNLLVAVACKIVEAFLHERHGNSGACLALAACLFCEADHDTKYERRLLKKMMCAQDQADLTFSLRLAETALAITDPNDEIASVAVAGLVRHWRYPLPNCIEHMLKGYNVGRRSGNLRMASYSAWGYIIMYIFSGLPLSFLAKDTENIFNIMVDYNQMSEAARIVPVWQLMLNMLGQTSNILDLQNGVAMDRAAKLGVTPKNGSTNLDIELMFFIHCQEMSLATGVFEKLEKTQVCMMRFHVGWHMRVFGLCLVAVYNARKRRFKSRMWRKKAHLYFSLVQTWVDDGKAINMGHKLKVLEAEMLTSKRPYPPDEVLMAAYDEAIVRSARSGFRQDAALAAAFAAEAVQSKLEKQKYAQRCQEFYASWDALGIIAHLRKRSRIHRNSCDGDFTSRMSSRGQGVQGRQRFLDEDGILQAHRSITVAEDMVEKETQAVAAAQERASAFST